MVALWSEWPCEEKRVFIVFVRAGLAIVMMLLGAGMRIAFQLMVTLILSISGVSGCKGPEPASEPNATSAADTTYYWQLSPEKRSVAVAFINGFRLGDYKEDVIKKLGQPDEDVEIKAKTPTAPSRGTWVVYRFALQEKNGGYDKRDQYVVFIFNTENRLSEVRPENVPEIKAQHE